MKIDEELVRGCQRYLAELKRRSDIAALDKAERKEAELQRSIKREHWRKVLYGGHGKGLTTMIIPEGSRLYAE